MLRLPLEQQRRVFKQCQIRIDHEQKKQNEMLRAATRSAGSSSTDGTIKAIDEMLKRMETMKDELQKLHDEEENLHEQTAKRVEHLQALYDIPNLLDVKYEHWSKVRLDRLIVDYLLRAGYSDTAAALASAKDVESLIDLSTFKQCHKVADSILQGSTVEALKWITRNKDALKKHLEKQALDNKTSSIINMPKITTLEFELRFQEYITFLVQHSQNPGSTYEAIIHAQKYLSPYEDSFPQQTRIIAGLLAVDPSNPSEPYLEYFLPSRWTFLAELFIETHHALFQLPARPLIHVALSAGLSALKTPACHSALNPASADNPTKHAKFTPISNKSHGIGTSLCPICSTELNALARNVPYAHHTVSSVENDPLMLPNGRVYGRERLEELERKAFRTMPIETDNYDENPDIDTRKTVIDPVTGTKFSWHQLRKVYIT